MEPDDMVYLTLEDGSDGGELRRRSELPDDALRAGLDVDGEHVDGGQPGVSYEVWTVDR